MSEPPAWNILSPCNDVVKKIFCHVGWSHLHIVARVCREWKNVIFGMVKKQIENPLSGVLWFPIVLQYHKTVPNWKMIIKAAKNEIEQLSLRGMVYRWSQQPTKFKIVIEKGLKTSPATKLITSCIKDCPPENTLVVLDQLMFTRHKVDYFLDLVEIFLTKTIPLRYDQPIDRLVRHMWKNKLGYKDLSKEQQSLVTVKNMILMYTPIPYIAVFVDLFSNLSRNEKDIVLISLYTRNELDKFFNDPIISQAIDTMIHGTSRRIVGECYPRIIERKKLLQEFNIELCDVEIVAHQASVSNYQAIEALKRSKGDILNAILELTEFC